MKQLRLSRRGSTAAEFALVWPLLLAMLWGTCEYSIVLYNFSAMQFGANVVARDISVNALVPADAQNAARQLLPAWFRNDVNVTVLQTNAADPRVNVVTIRMQAPANKATPLSIITSWFAWTLTSEASVHQELPF